MTLPQASGERKRRLPVLSTLVVLLAVGVMIRLGFWQLGRMDEKESQLARFQTAQAMSSLVPLPTVPAQVGSALFRRSAANCISARDFRQVSGRNHRLQSGYVHVARCLLPDAVASFPPDEQPIVEIDVVLGWSRSPDTRDWKGGTVEGVLAPSNNAEGFKLVAMTPTVPGLEANAGPDPREVPNNHFAYAVQWFLFAATALVIYALALRKRLAGSAPPR